MNPEILVIGVVFLMGLVVVPAFWACLCWLLFKEPRRTSSVVDCGFSQPITLSYGVVPRINDIGFHIAKHVYDPSNKECWFEVVYDGTRPVVAADMRAAKRKVKRLMDRKYSALFDMDQNPIDPPNEHDVGDDMYKPRKVH